jgi:hypothetical protein
LFVGFIDSDWVSDLDDQNSTTGYVFRFGYGPGSWACKKQQTIALYSTKVEYRTTINASQESFCL